MSMSCEAFKYGAVCCPKGFNRVNYFLLLGFLHKSHPLASMKIKIFLKEFSVNGVELVWLFFLLLYYTVCKEGKYVGDFPVWYYPSFTYQAQLAVKLPQWSRVRSWAWSWSLLCPSFGTCSGANGYDSQISLSSCCCHLGALLPLCTTESLWVRGQQNAVWGWCCAPL